MSSSPRAKISTHYGRFLLNHRRGFTIALALLCLLGAGGLLQIRFDGEPRKIFQRSDSDFERLEQYFEDFGADDNDIVLVLHGPNLFSSDFSEALRAFTKQARETEGVRNVVSILDVPGRDGKQLLPEPSATPDEFAQAREVAVTHPFLSGQLLAPSGNTMLVTIMLEDDGPQTLEKIRPVYQNIRGHSDQSFQDLDLEFSYVGSVAVRIETLVGVRREFFQITAIGAAIAFLIALLLFRNVFVTLVVAAGPTIAVLWTLGFMGWMGLDIEGISTPLPSIIFVVAFANAVHLMVDIRRSRRDGKDGPDAARTALSHLGLACFLTSLTTAIGFGSLMLAETASVQRFGFCTALGSFLGLCSNLTIVPLLSSLPLFAKRIAPKETTALPPTGQSLLGSLAKAILWCAIPINLFALIATSSLIYAASQLKSDIVWTETLPSDNEITRAMELCDAEFGGAMHAAIVISWDDSHDELDPEVFAVLKRIESLIESDPTFHQPLSILNVLPPGLDLATLPPSFAKQLPALIPEPVLKRLLRPDLRQAVITLRLPNDGAAAVRPGFSRLRSDLDSLAKAHPGFSSHLTGSAVVAADNMTGVIGDLVRSLAFASITVFLVLTIALRSLKLGLISVIPNAFPLLLNAGVLYALDKPLQITSVLTFSICLGIAVDDTIHFLIRYLRGRKEGLSARNANIAAFESVGLALLITTSIIAGGFLAATTSSMPGLIFFGGLACCALVAALIGDLLILPALLYRIDGRKERLAARESE